MTPAAAPLAPPAGGLMQPEAPLWRPLHALYLGAYRDPDRPVSAWYDVWLSSHENCPCMVIGIFGNDPSAIQACIPGGYLLSPTRYVANRWAKAGLRELLRRYAAGDPAPEIQRAGAQVSLLLLAHAEMDLSL